MTHNAPVGANGNLIEAPVTQDGVIDYEVKPLGLCAGLTNAAYTSTTEVYPDSQGVTDEQCILAQVAAVKGGLDYIIRHRQALTNP